MSQTKTCCCCGDPNHLIRNCPQSYTPSQSVRSAPYWDPSRQSGYQGVGKGSQHVHGSQGGHPPPVQVSVGRNYARATVPATSGTTGPSMIRGIIPLFTSWASILFDMGASHSFISSTLASSLGLKVDCLDVELHMSTPIEGIICLNQVYYGCLFSIYDG